MSKAIRIGFALALGIGLALGLRPLRASADESTTGFERTPPRLSFVDGAVSFWREGADGWTPARVNTPLAPGDQLYVGTDANAELQVGPRAFVRAGENTQLSLSILEPDYLQLRVTEGNVSLDLRSLRANQTLEVATPNAAFTVERTGYYRIEVDGDTTAFASRRGGRASVALAAGPPLEVAASDQVVVTGLDAPRVETYAAPELDAWDRWNYARTDDQLDSVSARYVSSDLYGAYDLDAYGDWRIVPSYGAIWVPHAMAAGWAPYSTGRWLWDPYYGWTWVDEAPWGWAPFHYGRWVFVSGFWAWCPGPLVVRTYYAPALVAFYGGGVGFGFSVGAPRIGWVALGWGEPLVPWWGPPAFRSRAHWAGWGGPRVVNRVVVRNATVFDARRVEVYENASVRNAIVGVGRDGFGRRSGPERAFEREAPKRLKVLRGEPPAPDRSSLAADARTANAPPPQLRDRHVVAIREPRRAAEARLPAAPEAARGSLPAQAIRTRAVAPPPARRQGVPLERPPFGSQSTSERKAPAPPPRYARPERAPSPPQQAEPADASRGRQSAGADAPRSGSSRAEAPAPRPGAAPARGAAVPSPERRTRTELPGEPANRVYRIEQRDRSDRGARDARSRGAESQSEGERRKEQRR